MTATKLETIYERFSQAYPEESGFLPEEKIYDSHFKSLVGVVLSAQTQDSRTFRACVQLFEKVSTPEEMVAIDLAELTDLIRPVGMFNVKASNLKLLSQQLIDRHGGQVPNDREQLMALAGVGRKSTDIIMRFVFNQPAIAVDTHVHRLCNRLGIANTKVYDKTAEILEEQTPDQYRWQAHEWLITHGKTVCKSRKPQCGLCMLTDLCNHYEKLIIPPCTESDPQLD